MKMKESDNIGPTVHCQKLRIKLNDNKFKISENNEVSKL